MVLPYQWTIRVEVCRRVKIKVVIANQKTVTFSENNQLSKMFKQTLAETFEPTFLNNKDCQEHLSCHIDNP